MKRIMSFVIPFLICVGVFLLPNNTHAAEINFTAGKVNISSGWLNVRSGSSSTTEALTKLSNGDYITLISKSGAWWYVMYDYNKYGYCSATYITTVPSSNGTVDIQSGTLNIRSGSGTAYQKIGSLNKGDNVIILSTSNGWSKILYNGTKIGYVSSQYISNTKYTAVVLNVPSFKQTDSRWANVKIGSSGKTISQIGCATTAISMIESYRTGTAIYPDAMSKKLKYTSSGSVYWPSNYTAVTSSSEYLTAIYNQLKAGKPVLFGVKNKYGSQHWVVITGFTGANTLSASYFTINDPGSNTRKNLQQLLNSYPNFYKYFKY